MTQGAEIASSAIYLPLFIPMKHALRYTKNIKIPNGSIFIHRPLTLTLGFRYVPWRVSLKIEYLLQTLYLRPEMYLLFWLYSK